MKTCLIAAALAATAVSANASVWAWTSSLTATQYAENHGGHYASGAGGGEAITCDTPPGIIDAAGNFATLQVSGLNSAPAFAQITGPNGYEFSLTVSTQSSNTGYYFGTVYGSDVAFPFTETDFTSNPNLNTAFHLKVYEGNSALGNLLLSGNLEFTKIPNTACPEPTTYALVAGLSLAGFATWRRARH
jgi:hypothetical protein